MLNIIESGHAERILQRLDSKRKEEKNCDLVVSAEGRKIHVNRHVLCAASDYFDAMFSHDTKEKQEGVVDMKDVQFSSVEKCIDYIYSGKLAASEDECEGLLYCSSLMQLNEVCGRISPFLESRLNLKSFFNIKAIAAKFSLLNLNSVCDEFASEQFVGLSKEEEFNNLDVDYVSFLLSSKKSSDPETEDLKLKVGLQWINSDIENREGHLMKFVKMLDTSKLSAEYSKLLVENEPLCMKFPEFMKELFIGMAQLVHAKTAKQSSEAEPSSPSSGISSSNATIALSSSGQAVEDLPISSSKNSDDGLSDICLPGSGAAAARPENAAKTLSHADSPNSLFLFDKSSKHVLLYQPSRKEVTKVKGYRSEMKTNILFVACVAQGKLYVFDENRNTFRLDVTKENSTWEQREDLLYDHKDAFHCAVHQNYVYVGGNNKMERYDLDYDEFKNVDLCRNICHQSVLVGYGDWLFNIGGKYKRNAVNRVSKFYPEHSELISVPDMNMSRQDASAAVFNDSIYVAGGQSYRTPLCDAKMYEDDSELWTILPKMNTPRHLFRLCVVGDRILAVGNGLGECLIEFYDSQRKKWFHDYDHPNIEIWAQATVATNTPE